MSESIGATSTLWIVVMSLKRIGVVVAVAALGIIAWGLLAGLASLVMSGSFTDLAAQEAGRDGARYALSLGGSVGACIGACFSADSRRLAAPNVAGWIVAAVLTLFFVIASLGAA